MDNLFDSIESFGIKDISDMYFKARVQGTEKSTFFGDDPNNYLFEVEVDCPVCEAKFKTTKVKAKKATLTGIDTDLRPNYDALDTVAYDTISCLNCRYTASNTNFAQVMTKQVDDILQTVRYKVLENPHEMVYTYQYAIDRYKLAILSSKAKNAPASESAFYYMKLAWLYRALNDKVREYYFLEQAYEGFCISFNEEDFPIMGNDEHTFKLFTGELARRLGRYEESKKWIGSLLVDRTINDRIRQRAEEIKEFLIVDIKNAK